MKQVLLTDRMAAEMLSCSRSNVWRLVAGGLIPRPIKIGGMTRWKLEDIETVIENADVYRRQK